MAEFETYTDGTPRQPIGDRDIALVMTAMRMVAAGKSEHDPEQIQYEYSSALAWLKEFCRQSQLEHLPPGEGPGH